MCIFSGPVNSSINTRISARRDGDRQILVYSINYAASGQLAMLLPLPVAAGSSEQAALLIKLQGYGSFFEDLTSAFMVSLSDRNELTLAAASAPLRVQEVGRFEASCVPGIAGFDRLDPRFRLPDHLWSHLPRYLDWGFAVFKLKATGPAGADPALSEAVGLVQSDDVMNTFMDSQRTEGAIEPDASCWQRHVNGVVPNEDARMTVDQQESGRQLAG